MLKIKDDIDLKELEKFGFKLSKTKTMKGKEYENWFNNNGIEIKGDKTSRKGLCARQISNPHCLGHNENTFDVLYELIKAGLVEKVEEN